MAVRIRLQRHGRKKHPVYHVVVAHNEAPRDGRFIEKLGVYDPTTIPAMVDIRNDRALYWLQQGAQPTPTARRLLSVSGVLFQKHLQRGIRLGVLTQEAADAQWARWLEQSRQKREEAARREMARRKKRKKGDTTAAAAT